MYQEMIDVYAAQAEKMVAPVQQFARLSLKNGEKLYAMQLEVAQSYVNLGVEQLQAMIEVRDPESLKAFVSKQADVAKNVGEKMIADARAVAELGNEINTETQKLARESLGAVTQAA